MEGRNAVATRQRTDPLWDSSELLASGGTFTGAVRLVAGYGGINIFIASNLSFRLRMEEACSEDGPWTETDRQTSALNEEGTRQVICRRFVPCGAYARIRVDNLGGATMTVFSLCLLGLPIGDSSTATLAGPDGALVDVRNADADDDGAAALNGFVTNARIWALGSADWQRLRGRPFDSGSIDESLFGLLARAAITGSDSSAAVGSRNVPVEARDFNVDADVDGGLVALTVNARLAGYRIATGNWARLQEDTPAAAAGSSTGSVLAVYANSIAFGIDNTGAAVIRPVEARNYDVNAGDVTTSLIGLLCNTRNALFYPRDVDWGFFAGTRADSLAGAQEEREQGAFVYQARESAFAASLRGRRFYSTHQTPNTAITAQASFVATTPTFLLRQAATSVRVILRSISIFIVNTPTDDVRITVAIDTADRFSAGGTSHTPQNANEESATASGITSFLSNPTATAAGAGTRYLMNTLIDNSAPSTITINFKDGVLLSTTASLLVYVFGNGGATPADVYWVAEWEEVA